MVCWFHGQITSRACHGEFNRCVMSPIWSAWQKCDRSGFVFYLKTTALTLPRHAGDATANTNWVTDGAFLIRASQSRRGYSLTVKFRLDGFLSRYQCSHTCREIRHVVIVESKGKFGFSEPTTFDSLPVRLYPRLWLLADKLQGLDQALWACFLSMLQRWIGNHVIVSLQVREVLCRVRWLVVRTAPEQKPAEIEAFDADLTEEVYISNVSALRESIDRQARDLRYTQRMAASYSTVWLLGLSSH